MRKRESLAHDDKILRALRILTRGETMPPEDSDIGKTPTADFDVGKLEVAEETDSRR
jgi:hypothetical protein